MMLLGNINAIPFRRRFGGGGGTPFPYIPGMIARYSGAGLTNEDMSTNPVWKDLTGNGHDLQMKNFGWAGMSGVNGYVENYNSKVWTFNSDRAEVTHTDNAIHIAKVTDPSTQIYRYYNTLTESSPNYIRVTGLPSNAKLQYRSNYTIYITIESDGIYTLPKTVATDLESYYGFKITTVQESCNITIEQLPLYPGALVFDGVDDYGVCENFPILTKEKGYTVVALRQWLSFQDIGYPTLVVNSTDRLAAFSFEDFRSKTKSTWNWGRSVELSDYKIPLLYTYQTSTSYNSKTISAGATEEGSNILQVCRSGVYCANAAIWEIVILDHDATEEELTKIKDYFVKIYPWLFPDQAWTVTGKTNEDEDRATIANITGNGNDLQLKNFAFSGSSGHGLYDIPSPTTWAYYGVTKVNLTQYSVQLTDRSHVNQDLLIFFEHGSSLLVAGTYNFTRFRFKITNPNNHPLSAFFRGDKSLWNIDVTESGIYEFPGITLTLEEDANTNYGFELATANEIENFSVIFELLPKYAGYLVTDGVDDKVQRSSFTMNEDWTIVGDWELLSNVQINCGIVKAQNVYLYNTANGLFISINNPRSLQSFGTKSLHAICSDGRLYDRNWVEYKYTVDQNFKIVESSLNIGFNLNNYTQIAFKNLGIYNNQILSKDDCIKAYNYLQTLKAK